MEVYLFIFQNMYISCLCVDNFCFSRWCTNLPNTDHKKGKIIQFVTEHVIQR